MTQPLIKTRGLDHVHLYVKDRPAAIAWYQRVLGLRLYGKWRNDDPAPDHPVFLSPSAGGDHCLSLFVGERPQGGDRTVAFHATGTQFIDFASALPDDGVLAIDGTKLEAGGHYDYGLAITFNFLDPAGNHLELVTYEVDVVRDRLRALS